MESQGFTIPSGTFQFQFPVMVPEKLPVASEWYLSLCTEVDCSHPSDSSVRMSFAVPNMDPILPASRSWMGRVGFTSRASRFCGRRTDNEQTILMLFLITGQLMLQM